MAARDLWKNDASVGDESRPGAIALFAAIPLAFALVGVIEAARVPLAATSPAAVALAIGESYLALGVVAPAMLIAALGALAAARWRAAHRLTPLVALLAAAAGAGVSYLTLIGYPRFVGFPPFLVAWGGMAAFVATLYYAIAVGRWPRLAAFAGAAAIAVSLAGLAAAGRFRDYYPTLHVSLGMARALLFHAGVAAILRAAAPRPRRAIALAAPGLALLAVGALATALVGASSPARRAVADHTVVGPAAVLEGGPADDECAAPPAPLDDATADAILAEAMPPLPAGLDLAGMDVLVVFVEALRFDQTSMAGKDTTPALARLAAEGFSFTRAQAPASRTWLSIASIFTMAMPSQARIKTRVPAWTGDLLSDATTVAELYADAGYHTESYRHDFEGNVGLNQGFAVVHEEPGRVLPREVVDRNLVLRAIDALGAAAGSGPRFTFAFLLSPHEPYLPPLSTFEGYTAGVRHFDAELGRLLAALERSGRADRTIVVVAADHGEEFREHGHFARHGLTLYQEVVHVPLVVRIPGAPGGTIERPTSLAFLFPWLMSRAAPPLRTAARAAVKQHLGPVHRATDGGAAMENLDQEESYLAIVAAGHSAHFDYRTSRLEVYDLAADPGEKRDLGPTGGPAVAAAKRRVDAYRQVRACTRRAEISEEPGPTRNNLEKTAAVPYAPVTELGRAAVAR